MRVFICAVCDTKMPAVVIAPSASGDRTHLAFPRLRYFLSITPSPLCLPAFWIKLYCQLCLKYPLKHRVLVGFLATFLREEGGFEFKKAITDCIVELMTAIPETKACFVLFCVRV